MSKRIIMTTLKIIVILLIIAILIPALFVAVSVIRPNRSMIADELGLEVWPAVADGRHNSNTDLVFFKDTFWLIHASAPWHFASETTRLILCRSTDARTWEKVAEFQNPGEDIRDPKFAIIGGRLILYALKNTSFAAEPYLTVAATSDDGVVWTEFVDMKPDGWLFWRPRSSDGGKTWYVPAYWHEHGKSALLKSTDGLNWEINSIIYSGDSIDETAALFLPDGRMLITGRLEVAGYYFGDNRGNTLIATSEPPFMTWSYQHSNVTRLDGPTLFSYNGRVYAVGRFEPGKKPFLFETGSILAKKRTSLFLVEEDRLVWLSDLPSAGDTSYSGVVIRGDEAYISYYTSSIKRDYPWIIGMLSKSDIMMAKVDLVKIEALAIARTACQ
ncbi:MAG: exo-alpha-sialidase [Deltaproteobacteria bacterium]|nr:exo-alpha-sialidase [Candidatus Zymogenaceae bacterium]